MHRRRGPDREHLAYLKFAVDTGDDAPAMPEANTGIAPIGGSGASSTTSSPAYSNPVYDLSRAVGREHGEKDLLSPNSPLVSMPSVPSVPSMPSMFSGDGSISPAGGSTPGEIPLQQLPNGRWTSSDPAWAHLINRESGGNPTIKQQIHDVNSGGNEAEGLFQITPATWKAHGGDTAFGVTNPALATPQQQAEIAKKILMSNPSGSDWGAGLAGRENAQELMRGLNLPKVPSIPKTGGHSPLFDHQTFDDFNVSPHHFR